FSIPGGGVQTINVGSSAGVGHVGLPNLVKTVTIDGTTEPGVASGPGIVLNGTQAGASANGLVLAASSCTIKGLVIQQFSQSGVVISASRNNLVVGDYIGTDVHGTAALGNSGAGIIITLAASGNTVGGTAAGAANLISANGFGVGIVLGGTSAN